MSSRKISEIIKTKVAFTSADVDTAVASDVYVNMADFERISAVIVVRLSKTKKVVVQLMQATDAAGTGAKVLGTAVTVTNSSGLMRDCIARVEAQASDLDNDDDFTFVGVSVDADESANAAGIFICTVPTYSDGIAQSNYGVSPTTTAEATTTAAATTTGA